MFPLCHLNPTVIMSRFCCNSAPCVHLAKIRARRMLAFLKGRDVGNRHRPHHCHSLAARAACNWVVLYFCHCLANNVRHQYAPTLGHAIRIGEAKNPGPNRGTCLINMVLANPTSLANKKDTLTQLLTRTSKCTVLGRNFCHRRNTVTMPKRTWLNWVIKPFGPTQLHHKELAKAEQPASEAEQAALQQLPTCPCESAETHCHRIGNPAHVSHIPLPVGGSHTSKFFTLLQHPTEP